MKIDWKRDALLLLLAFALVHFKGLFVDALSYDYTAVHECLANPQKPQYGGGIIKNPEMNDGLKGWTTFGGVKIEQRVSANNNFIVAHSRLHPYDSSSQKLFLEKDKLYTFSAWIQITGKRNIPVIAMFKTSEGFKSAGSVIAQVGCWSMLKGGITVESSNPAELYFQSDDTSVDIWVDNVSLQPFTQEEWRSHQHQSIEKVRKSKVKFQVIDSKGRPVPYTNISVNLKNAKFPIGASINNNIINNVDYQNWFTSKSFTVTTFENEMKWYTTETSSGKEDYSSADAMLEFTSKHGIQVRGHNIFWDDPQHQPEWIPNLSQSELLAATNRRLNSIVSRYRGKVIAWDVNNEILHFNYFESKLGLNISDVFYKNVSELDPSTTLFMNDYNTIEDSGDVSSSPSSYINKLKEISEFAGNTISLGIGLESHFNTANIPYVRSALDTLASTNYPIWITELDVQEGPNQISYFEQILREAYSHPGIQGIVMWSPWSPQGPCYHMCLVNPNFQNEPAGNVLDNLLNEWGRSEAVVMTMTTGADGFINTSLLHGNYLLQHQRTLDLSSISQSFTIDAHSSDTTITIIAQD